MRLEELENKWQAKTAKTTSFPEVKIIDLPDEELDKLLCNNFCRAAGHCTGSGTMQCCAEYEL
jgi:hypothetical protein